MITVHPICLHSSQGVKIKPSFGHSDHISLCSGRNIFLQVLALVQNMSSHEVLEKFKKKFRKNSLKEGL